ncbi:MAG: hypothetical protein PHD95_06060 [Candidatus ainarchaeum sp.]|nr:hypothetical protein [Candidatus ainarchaeum sp.]
MDSRTVFFLLAFGLIIALVVTVVYGINKDYFDTKNYLKATRILQGKAAFSPEDEEMNLRGRFLRPLQLALNSLEPIPLEKWFYFLNVIFFLSAGLCVYGITLLLFEDRALSLFSGILFFSSAIAIQFSLTLLTEAGTYFFYALGILVALFYYKKHPESKKLAFASALIFGLGVLMKESAGIGIVLLLMLVLFSKNSRSFNFFKSGSLGRIVFAAALLAVFLVPTLIAQALVFFSLNYTYIDYVHFQLTSDLIVKPMFTLPRFLIAFLVSFTILIPGFLYAFLAKARNKKEIALPICMAAVGLLPILMYLTVYDRLVFMLFPIAIPFGLLGTQLFLKRHFPAQEKIFLMIFIILFIALNIAGFVLYRNLAISGAVAKMF